jgi:hypothetical protein
MRTISAGIVALVVGFAIGSEVLRGVGPGSTGLSAEASGSSDFGAARSTRVDHRTPQGSRSPNGPIRMASLETSDVSAFAVDDEDDQPESTASARSRLSFEERFSPDRRATLDQPTDSFSQRFASALPDARNFARPSRTEPANRYIPLPSDVGPRVTSHAGQRTSQSGPKLASLTSTIIPSLPAKSPGIVEASLEQGVPTEDNSRTAIYDIVAHTVYLPSGKRLEAHSGLGSYMDDPRSVHVKDRGPTPPNVYNLTLRERPFHGVRAIRLTPAEGSTMYGRDGILAHSYMLGPNGQSNGCVSFSDYPAFLNAFLSGEVDRLVVVERLTAPPKTDSGWFTATIKHLFKGS